MLRVECTNEKWIECCADFEYVRSWLDLAAVTANHGMRSVIQDDLVWVHNITEIYLKLAFNVDDILCAYKDDAADKYEMHLNKRWKVKSMGLDGWLGNQFYPNPAQNTMTITMDVRLCEYMKEHARAHPYHTHRYTHERTHAHTRARAHGHARARAHTL